MAMLAGGLLAGGLFALTGRAPRVVEYLVAIILGSAICLLGGYFAQRSRRDEWTLGQRILEAMERIGQGDFAVHINDSGRGPFTEVVASVNTMARDLGTLERQRQDFVSNVSHEIQSPLTSIIGFANLLRDPALDPARREHYLDVIAAECRRLSDLGSNLLRLSALDGAELDQQRFRLDEQLREVILALEPQWSPTGLEIELECEEVWVRGDPELLRQVWVNLISNAVKFTEPAGNVSIRLIRDGSGRPDPAEVPGWRVVVTDTGIGIQPGDLPHIFERFFRADRARGVGGNGLGLALVKRVVDLHGWSVDVSSTPGEGSRFSVRIPFAAAGSPDRVD
jgi:signal transduction histidine kinase